MGGGGARTSAIIGVARRLPAEDSICQGPHNLRRGGRVAEGGGLLNRYRVKSSIGGSNPPLSARFTTFPPQLCLWLRLPAAPPSHPRMKRSCSFALVSARACPQGDDTCRSGRGSSTASP